MNQNKLLNKELNYPTNKNITGVDTMNVDIDKVKTEVQNTTTAYIVGLKFVTTETVDEVVHGIKRDLEIYPNIARFVTYDPIIKIGLTTNATPCAYYFLNKEVYDKVVGKLPEFNIPITKI